MGLRGREYLEATRNALEKTSPALHVPAIDSTEFNILKKLVAEKDEQLAKKDRDIANLIADKETQIQAEFNSLSWRITKPLRFIFEMFKK